LIADDPVSGLDLYQCSRKQFRQSPVPWINSKPELRHRKRARGFRPSARASGYLHRTSRYWFLLVLLLAAGGAWWWSIRTPPSVHYATAPITRGTIARAVNANPILTIIVESYVSGAIQQLSCDYNPRSKPAKSAPRSIRL
jgi:hypothetical protein